MNMKKILLALLSVMTLCASAQSHHLTAEEAMQRVGLQQRTVAMHRAPVAAGSSIDALYYIFNIDGGGFVIASADDRARAILGRSDEGQWDPNNIAPAMQGWLESMSEGLKRLAESDADEKPAQAPVHAASTRVEPLLGAITWGQGEPYFNECPAIGSSHSATGCAATAMAQIMRFHSYPERGAGSNSYVSETIKFNISENFSQTVYDWTNMKTSYPMSVDGKTKYYTDQEATAVARLMYHLGAASNMDYNTGASGTTEAPMLKAMIDNFQYDRGLQIYYRDYFTSPEWYALLQNEIDAQRPVLMNGYSISGGHAFVIDGYDTKMGEGYFHFNWGWNGMSNGYYTVDVTDPGQQGTGGSLGGYSYNQNVFVGIQPPTGVTAAAQPNLCVTEALKYAREQIYFAFRNRGCGAFTGEVGYAVEQDGKTSFTALGTLNEATFNQGGNYHFTPAVSKAGARVYAAYRATDGTIQPMAPIVGTPSVLVSQMSGSKVVYVAESADMPALQVTSVAIAGDNKVSYAGYNTTFDFTVKNTGAAEYNGPLYLCITELDAAGNPTIEEYHTADNPLGVYIRPGESYTSHMTYYNDTYLLVGHRYSCEIIYNPRNSSSFVHIPGAKAIFDVELYKAPSPKNPPVIKVLSQELSATTVEQGKQLTLKLKVNNTGGTDAVPAGGVIYQKKGSSPKGYLGEQVISFPVGESEWSFTGAVNVEPGSYRLLPGWDDNGWWEIWNYDYLYFDVTENTDPDPEPGIDPDQPDPGVDPDKPDPGVDPENPDHPQPQYIDLPLDDVFAYHYANEKFSKPGAYDYFFNYGNLTDDGGFPWLLFHILQPTNDGISAGTYSLADGTLRLVLLRNMDDYNTYKQGTTVNTFCDASVTLTNHGGNNWQMQFEGRAAAATAPDGAPIIYRADVTLPITASTTQDANDPLTPNSGEGGGDGSDPDQPTITDVVNLDINYCEVELWTNPQFSPDGHYDYYFQMVKREEGAAHANKWPYVDFDIYLPVKGALQSGTYMLNDKFCNFALIQNNEDERAYENWEDNYGFGSGSVTLTHNGGDNWTIEVEMVAADGTLYLIDVTQDITLRWRDEDPMVNPGINDTFNKESTTVGDYTIAFDLIDTSEQFIADRGFFYINLESSQVDAEGKRYVSEFFFRTEPTAVNVPAGTYAIPAGNYPMSFDDNSYYNFVASHGDGMTGGIYPSYIGLYDGKRITDVWYMKQGNITVSYDAEGDAVIIGELESHYGSKFHFTHNVNVVGIGTVLAPSRSGSRKVLTGGNVIIRREDNSYNINGVRVRN